MCLAKSLLMNFSILAQHFLQNNEWTTFCICVFLKDVKALNSPRKDDTPTFLNSQPDNSESLLCRAICMCWIAPGRET